MYMNVSLYYFITFLWYMDSEFHFSFFRFQHLMMVAQEFHLKVSFFLQMVLMHARFQKDFVYHYVSPIPSSQGWACGPSACTYIIMYLFFYDVIGVCLIFIFYEFYLFIFF